MRNKLFALIIVLLIILSPVSYAITTEVKESEDETSQPKVVEGETDSVRYKIVGQSSSQSIQWNKIDKDSSPKINTEKQMFCTFLLFACPSKRGRCGVLFTI